ncbi:hypothetical protein BSKO_12229 [Bryopsis sp. KO-2023]|nr:hypothetical protein BSKO_12229 [Bryopsis sp. KO-2023]
MGSAQANVDVRVCKVDDPDLLKIAYRVRENVFVDEQGVDRDDEIDQFEDAAHHFVALGGDGNGVGAARWRTTEKGVKLERFSVNRPFRGRGVGSKLVAAVLDDIRSTEGAGQLLYLHSQLPAVEFYERHGFSKIGEKFSECDIWHYLMEKEQ